MRQETLIGLFSLIVLCGVLLTNVPVSASDQGEPSSQAVHLSFTDAAWAFDGDVRVEEHLGRTALRMRSGQATPHDVVMEDGTIEFDVAATTHRAFVYVRFRVQDIGEHEEYYLRTHKSELPDAIQYTPVYKRVSNWQLYHGEGYTAAAELPADVWTHVKLVVQGRQAALFVGDMETPRIITPLARKQGPGAVSLRGFLPRNAAEDGVYTANFADLVVRPGVVDYDFPDLVEPEQFPGVVKHWQVSPTFPSQQDDVAPIPDDVAAADWKTIEADPSGLVVFDRHLERPKEERRLVAVAAKLVIDAEEAGRRRFDFGYSDRVHLMLNGELLMSGNARYSFNFPRRQGLIGFDQGAVYLPLQKGSNELVLVIDEVFGGWGVMGRFTDSDGLEY